MPELPEVEIVKQSLEKSIIFQKINEIIADYMTQEHPDLPADAGFSYSIVVDVD